MGNKNDCPEKKVVQTEDAQKFADQIGIQLYETSAKENLNVEEVGTVAWLLWLGFDLRACYNSLRVSQQHAANSPSQ